MKMRWKLVASTIGATLVMAGGCGGGGGVRPVGPATANWTGLRECYSAETFATAWAQIAQDCDRASQATDATAPDVANALYNLGKARVELGEEGASGQFAQASTDLTRALNLYPARNDIRTELARAKSGDGRPNEALDLINQVIQSESFNARAYYVRSKILSRRGAPGDLDSALRDLERALQLAASVQPVPDAPLRNSRQEQFVNNIRGQLEAAAIAVGKEAAAAAAPTRETARLAVDAFDKARSAAPQSLDVHLQLGDAQLQLAAVSATPQAALPFACAPGTGNENDLINARLTFAQATNINANSSAANEGLACAYRALGGAENLRQAQEYYRRASATGGGGVLLSLAHTQKDLAEVTAAGSLGSPADPAGAEAIMADAIRNYEAALASGAQGDVETLLDIADAYLARAKSSADPAPHLANARSYIERATAANQGSPAAYLKLGEFHFNEGERDRAANPDGGSAAYALAYQNFEQVRARTSGTTGGNDQVRATALYYLSRLVSEGKGGSYSTANRNEAVVWANEARNFDVENIEFRNQACLAHIRAGKVMNSADSEQARTSCIADFTPEGLLLRGMYYLRRSHFTTVIDNQRNELQNASQAFREGQDRLVASTPTSQNPQSLPVWQRLQWGQSMFMQCNKYPEEASRIRGVLSPAAGADAQRYFDTYGVNQCDR